MTRPLCIYHGHCADGFAAAWVVRKAFLGQVDFHAGCYGDDPPEVSGRDVFLVDFSYPRPVLEVMVAVADSVTILDHHVTAAEDLDFLPGAITRFDLDHSGGMITWQYFFGSQTPPALLAHIEDRDLWRFRIDGTREIMAGLFSYPYDFDLYDYWFVHRSQTILFGYRQKCRFPLARYRPNVFQTGDPKRHSEKPDASYELIEAVSPGPRLELFARRKRGDWHTWGNEVPCDVSMGHNSGVTGAEPEAKRPR